MPGEPLVCRCYRVTEAEIRKAIAEGRLSTVEQVTEATGAAGGCGSCYDDVLGILSDLQGTAIRRTAGPSPAPPEMRIKVLDALRVDVIPLFEINELYADVLAIERDRVLVRFNGRGVGTTQPAFLTLKWYLVKIVSAACGHKMSLIEINILEETGRPLPPSA